MTHANDPGPMESRLKSAGYFASSDVAMALRLAVALERPLLLEGPAGVGKTELARAASRALQRDLIRLQCYEGLDESRALFEWDYAKQMLYTQLIRDALHISKPSNQREQIQQAFEQAACVESGFFSERFLIKRPILEALTHQTAAVLLIDEVDRADSEFEALLLEVLADFTVTIPEIGTIGATYRPLVILTTNGTRDLTDALRRRCLHAFVDYPESSREIEIVQSQVPELNKQLASVLVEFVRKIRDLDLQKAPSIAESVEWARAVWLLGIGTLDEEAVHNTIGILVKHHGDAVKVKENVAKLVKSSIAVFKER